MSSKAWSYSGIKSYQQCPKKHYNLKVLKKYVEPETEAMLYGTAFHEAAEVYVRGDAPLDPRFEFARKMLDSIKKLEGTKYCEYELGVTEDFRPCGFKDPEAWFRGIADVLIINGKNAKVMDYKTGKSAKYADADQLELMALAIFEHFPEVEKVEGRLLFVIANAKVKASYFAKDKKDMWLRWISAHNQLQKSFANGIWNPRTSGLCKKHCPVIECPHNGRH